MAPNSRQRLNKIPRVTSRQGSPIFPRAFTRTVLKAAILNPPNQWKKMAQWKGLPFPCLSESRGPCQRVSYVGTIVASGIRTDPL